MTVICNWLTVHRNMGMYVESVNSLLLYSKYAINKGETKKNIYIYKTRVESCPSRGTKRITVYPL